MNFEKLEKHEPKQEIITNSEQQEDVQEGSLFNKASRLLDGMNIPRKKTVGKWLAGALAGTAAMTAVESHNVVDDIKEIDIKENFIPIAQKAIEKSRTQMSFEKTPDTHSVAAYLDIPIEKVKEGAMYTTSTESLNEDTVINYSHNIEVPMSGDDVYFISKNALALVQNYDETNADEGNADLFHGFKSDARTFTFDGVEIEPIGQAMSFEASGATKSEAILEALEEGVGFVQGISINAQRDLETRSTTDYDNSEYSEKFTNFNSSVTEGFVDHYEVESVEEDEDGFMVKLKIVFGERPEYELPDGVQLAGGSKKSYYEINPDVEN